LGRVYEDCVPPIIFMLTPGCTYVTGQTMDVCGGLSLYNNYMKGYQNMDSLYEKMLADKAAKEAGGNSK